MCLRPAASCRLCLSNNINEGCLDLCKDASTSDQLQELLCLQWSLVSITSQPHHVCLPCHNTIIAFQSLKRIAHNNDIVLRDSDKVTEAKEECDDPPDDDDYVPNAKIAKRNIRMKQFYPKSNSVVLPDAQVHPGGPLNSIWRLIKL